MPTYQYACTDCDHRFEQVQSFSDDALTACPQCEGRLRKLFNAVGVVFKGSGFYRNDSREAAGKNGASATPAGEKANGASADKPAEKSGDKGGDTSGGAAGGKTGEKAGATSGGKSGASKPASGGSSSATPARTGGGATG